MGNSKYIEIIARAVIVHRGKILLCKKKKANYYFLPGGHVEFGESTSIALAREIREELGVRSKNIKFLTLMENIFRYRKGVAHEINFIYRVSLKDNNVRAMENHLQFSWIPLKELCKHKVLPKVIEKELNALTKGTK